jgi:hypothetical protein
MNWSSMSPMERMMILSGGMLLTGGIAASLILSRRIGRFTKVEVEASPDMQRSVVQATQQLKDDLIRATAESSMVAANTALLRKSQPISPSALDVMAARLYAHLGVPPATKVS